MSSRVKRSAKAKSGRAGKKSAMKRYIDDEALESVGGSDDSDGADNPEVDEEDTDSTLPPVIDLLRMTSAKGKGKGKASKSKLKKNVSEFTLLSDSSDDAGASSLVKNDRMYAGPSNLDASALPPPVGTRTRSKRSARKSTGVSAPAAKRIKTSIALPVVSDDPPLTAATALELFSGMLATYFPQSGSIEKESSPDVESPIDPQQAEILQLIADANADFVLASKPLLVSANSGSVALSALAVSKRADYAPVDQSSNEADRIIALMEGMDSAGIVAPDAASLVASAAAPYDLEAKQALEIADYMHNASTTAAEFTKAAEVNRMGDINAGRSMKGVVGVKSEPVFLSDLETIKIKYDSSALCGVSDPFLQDKALASTYGGLWPLPGGKRLFPAFPKQGDPFNYQLTGGRVNFSLWRNIIPTLDLGVAAPAMLFKSADGGYINPSRCDPSRFSIQPTSADASRYILLVDGRVATCVTAVMSSESVLVEGRAVGKAMPRKWPTGLMHNQEYERFESFVCLAFGAAIVYGQLSNGGLMFQSRMGPPKGTGSAKDITGSGLVSLQKGYVATPVVTQNSLGFDDTIPVYDARNRRLNFQTDLPHLNTKDILPLFQGEIPFGSFVVVGYTVTGWQAVPSINIDKIRHPHLGCNIMWAIVVGVRDVGV
ncbi:hypothetical protein C8J57DRAFT_1387555 [Mycena rebaudengoi]|nr:hypothetical protein C8J57DRAFT_1387555 [Mycena rebaudengoi]